MGPYKAVAISIIVQGLDRQRDQMDSFELNKIMGAVLGTLLFVMGVGFVAEAVYRPIEGRGPGYALPEPEPVAADGAAVAAAPEVPLGLLLASASAERGKAAVKKCQSCHNFGEGEPSKTGPHLYDVVMRPEGSVPDFAYSDALLAHNAAGDVWTYENLNHFITKPSDYAPGTKMNFAGVRTAEERADILAYLQTLSAEPKPFPAAEETVADPAAGVAPETTTEPSDVPGAADMQPETVDPAPAAATPTGAAPTSDPVAAPAEVVAPTDAPASPPAEAAPAPAAQDSPASSAAPLNAPAAQPAPAPAPSAEPAAPAAVTQSPTTTETDTQVIGTPTTSGTGPAATQPPAQTGPAASTAPGAAPVVPVAPSVPASASPNTTTTTTP